MALHNAFESLATESKQTDLNTLVNSLLTAAEAIRTAAEAINTKTTTVNTGAVTISNQLSQPLTDTQLRAADVKISLDGEQVSVSNFPATQAISASSLPLPNGAATETTLNTLNTKTPALGQATKTGSSPVVIASDQGNLGVTVSNTFATESTLNSLSNKLPTSLGQKTGANSTSVVIASDQSSLPVTVSGTVSTTGGLTDTQLRATPVPVSGTVSTGLSQPLTDTQLRATPVPVSISGGGGSTDVSTLNKEVTQLELLTEAVYLLSNLVNNIPRVDGNKRVLVSHAESSPAVTISANQALGTLQNLGAASRPADAIPFGVSYIASTSIYDKIIVS